MSVWLGIAAVAAVAAVLLKLRLSWARFQEDWDQALPEARQLYPTVASEHDKYQDRLERRDSPDFQLYDSSASSGVPDIGLDVGGRTWLPEEGVWYVMPQVVAPPFQARYEAQYVTPGPASEAQLEDLRRLEVGPGTPAAPSGGAFPAPLALTCDDCGVTLRVGEPVLLNPLLELVHAVCPPDERGLGSIQKPRAQEELGPK
ncbi:hypothetical protein [Tessaracoccus sp.]